MSKPLVSVIVPVYNAERYVAGCVESILRQSHEELDVILVDDGSTDSSPDLCDGFAARDPRVRVFHRENGGIGAAQNYGLDQVRGEYIAFADNDDILDRRNIEVLLHALDATGADMSKGRWRQFGLSQMDEVRELASRGCDGFGAITVVESPLRAYQTVFCKSLRLAGDMLGRKAEARYFNEANWCRLYKRGLWDGIRFPEGRYAQDVMVAGDLYLRMGTVADTDAFNEANWCRLYKRGLWDGIRFPEGRYAQDVMVAGDLYLRMGTVADTDAVLYHWLQSPGSVTHAQRDTAFYHDNFLAGRRNFLQCLDAGVTPSRSYYTLVGSVRDERSASDAGNPGAERVRVGDERDLKDLLGRLTPMQRAACAVKQKIRLAEKYVYDRNVKNMK